MKTAEEIIEQNRSWEDKMHNRVDTQDAIKAMKAYGEQCIMETLRRMSKVIYNEMEEKDLQATAEGYYKRFCSDITK